MIIGFSLFYLLYHYRPIKYRLIPAQRNSIDEFLHSDPCGRLIRQPKLLLRRHEFRELFFKAAQFVRKNATCDFFVRPFNISDDESSFPLAFTILIHDHVKQLDILLRNIYRKSNFYCIHVDLKSQKHIYDAILERIRCAENIILPSRRVNVVWGKFSVLEAERLCQIELLKRFKTWKYYFNLAATDIPLKTNSEIVEILKLYHNQNDITAMPPITRNRNTRTIMRLKTPVRLFKGEFHVLLSRAAAEYINQSSLANELFNRLNGTHIPDEYFYSTINRWSRVPGYFPENHDIGQTSFMTRYKLWSDRPAYGLCNGREVHTICNFQHADLWHLMTVPHFFANKYSLNDGVILPYCFSRYLDVRLEVKAQDEHFSMINRQFYSELPNVRFAQHSS